MKGVKYEDSLLFWTSSSCSLLPTCNQTVSSSDAIMEIDQHCDITEIKHITSNWTDQSPCIILHWQCSIALFNKCISLIQKSHTSFNNMCTLTICALMDIHSLHCTSNMKKVKLIFTFSSLCTQLCLLC